MAEAIPCQDISASTNQSHSCFERKGMRACDDSLTCFEAENFMNAELQSGRASINAAR